MKVEFTRRTQKRLQKKLKIVLNFGNINLIKKVSVLYLLAIGTPMEVITELWCVTEKTIYNWRNEFLYKSMECFANVKRGKGQPARLTREQKEELKKIIIEGPQTVGFHRSTWAAMMIHELILKKYKVSYNRHYICDLLKQIGLTYQKAKWIPALADPSSRELWKNETWPNLLLRARQENAVLLFEDEVSFAMWGSLGYTWAPRGQQPLVKTSGKRKCLKSYGVIDYFSGRFTFQIHEGRLNSSSYISFLKKVLKFFTGKIIIVHDGAPYHTSEDTKNFIQSQSPRLEIVGLPSYSPDWNVIEYLWKSVKATTHNTYFATFDSLKKCVHNALHSFQKKADELLKLCTSYDDMLNHVALQCA